MSDDYTSILLSIHPRHATKIYDGGKEYELRSHCLPVRYDERPVRVIVYETSPVRRVTGEFYCSSVIPVDRDEPDYNMVAAMCITLDEFRTYLAGKPTGIGYAHPIRAPKKYARPYTLPEFGLDRAPQSWRYLNTIPVDLTAVV